MAKQSVNQTVSNDKALSAVPLNQRQHWLAPAMIFGGLEFTIPVLTTGSTLAASFGISTILIILFISFIVLSWSVNTLNGYIGAKTGRPSSVVAWSSFGRNQARFVVGSKVFLVSVVWWSFQTALASEAICAMLGIDYKTQWFSWVVVTTILGFIFAIPSIIGYSSMKWVDYIAVPAGILLVIVGIYYTFQNASWENIVSWHPHSSMTITSAISIVLGLNVTQWVFSMDITRYAKPKWKDNILIPIGIVGVGLPLFLVGAVMSIGIGEGDIVSVMQSLGFPVWGFFILFLAAWTSQLVNNYSMGLAISNILNVNSGRGRALVTLLGSIVGIIVAISGVASVFNDYLEFSALFTAPFAAIMISDFFFVRKQSWSENEGWNLTATLALLIGVGIGVITQYIFPIGLPAVQALIVTSIAYVLLMKLKSRIAPDRFSEIG